MTTVTEDGLMMNLAEEFETLAGSEPIIGVVLSQFRDDKREHVGKLLTWQEARPLLDYNFISGEGFTPDSSQVDKDGKIIGEDGWLSCHAAFAWTETKVLFVSVDVGSEVSTSWLPRHPRDCVPDYGGRLWNDDDD